MGKYKNLSNKKFGRLLAVQISKRIKNKGAFWTCLCDCGKKTEVLSKYLSNNHVKSCGCIKTSFKHGKSASLTYRVWVGMRNRCLNPNNKDYKNYGGRGIKVCDRWKKFENFIEDMEEKPKNFSLDRRNNDGNYSPENCRWATHKEQLSNRRSYKLGKIIEDSYTIFIKSVVEELSSKNNSTYQPFL